MHENEPMDVSDENFPGNIPNPHKGGGGNPLLDPAQHGLWQKLHKL